MSVLSPSQFRAARALLGWSLAEAAREIKVSVSTLITAEGKATGRVLNGAGPGIQAAYEAAGVTFTDEADGFGLTFRITKMASRSAD